ncbi:MAG: carbohydrate binding family 9 domain-containing protein, partial [Bacteroidota bacterium]
MRPFLLTIFTILQFGACLAQETFEPPAEAPSIQATKALQSITLDGRLEEAIWRDAMPITDFIQKDPVQGNEVSLPTEAKILFDDDYLYVGAICSIRDRSDIRTQNLQRDFSYFQNDMFGIAIDGFLDKRNAMVYQTNPHGTQREILVMDGEIFNREWSGLWKVRTQILDSAWTVEMAIPWKTLRYPPGSDKLG